MSVEHAGSGYFSQDLPRADNRIVDNLPTSPTKVSLRLQNPNSEALHGSSAFSPNPITLSPTVPPEEDSNDFDHPLTINMSETEDMLNEEIIIDRMYMKAIELHKRQSLHKTQSPTKSIDWELQHLSKIWNQVSSSEDHANDAIIIQQLEKMLYSLYSKIFSVSENDDSVHLSLDKLLAVANQNKGSPLLPHVRYAVNRAHAMSYYKKYNFAMAMKYINPAISGCPKVDGYFVGGLADSLVLLSVCHSSLGRRDDALHSAKLAVNIAHERLDGYNKTQQIYGSQNNKSLELPPASKSETLGPVLDVLSSVILTYCTLASELEKSGLGHLSLEWYERAMQAAVKFNMEKSIVSELSKMIELSKFHQPMASPPRNKHRLNGGGERGGGGSNPHSQQQQQQRRDSETTHSRPTNSSKAVRHRKHKKRLAESEEDEEEELYQEFFGEGRGGNRSNTGSPSRQAPEQLQQQRLQYPPQQHQYDGAVGGVSRPPQQQSLQGHRYQIETTQQDSFADKVEKLRHILGMISEEERVLLMETLPAEVQQHLLQQPQSQQHPLSRQQAQQTNPAWFRGPTAVSAGPVPARTRPHSAMPRLVKTLSGDNSIEEYQGSDPHNSGRIIGRYYPDRVESPPGSPFGGVDFGPQERPETVNQSQSQQQSQKLVRRASFDHRNMVPDVMSTPYFEGSADYGSYNEDPRMGGGGADRIRPKSAVSKLGGGYLSPPKHHTNTISGVGNNAGGGGAGIGNGNRLSPSKNRQIIQNFFQTPQQSQLQPPQYQMMQQYLSSQQQHQMQRQNPHAASGSNVNIRQAMAAVDENSSSSNPQQYQLLGNSYRTIDISKVPQSTRVILPKFDRSIILMQTPPPSQGNNHAAASSDGKVKASKTESKVKSKLVERLTQPKSSNYGQSRGKGGGGSKSRGASARSAIAAANNNTNATSKMESLQEEFERLTAERDEYLRQAQEQEMHNELLQIESQHHLLQHQHQQQQQQQAPQHRSRSGTAERQRPASANRVDLVTRTKALVAATTSSSEAALATTDGAVATSSSGKKAPSRRPSSSSSLMPRPKSGGLNNTSPQRGRRSLPFSSNGSASAAGNDKLTVVPQPPAELLQVNEFVQQKVDKIALTFFPYIKGMKVEAKYLSARLQGSRTRWYPGRIVGANFAQGLYNIEFENGEKENNVYVDNIRIPENVSKRFKPVRPNNAVSTAGTTSKKKEEEVNPVQGIDFDAPSAKMIRSSNVKLMHENILITYSGVSQREAERKISRLTYKNAQVAKIQAMARGVSIRTRLPKIRNQILRERELKMKEKALVDKEQAILQSYHQLVSKSSFSSSFSGQPNDVAGLANAFFGDLKMIDEEQSVEFKEALQNFHNTLTSLRVDSTGEQPSALTNSFSKVTPTSSSTLGSPKFQPPPTVPEVPSVEMEASSVSRQALEHHSLLQQQQQQTVDSIANAEVMLLKEELLILQQEQRRLYELEVQRQMEAEHKYNTLLEELINSRRESKKNRHKDREYRKALEEQLLRLQENQERQQNTEIFDANGNVKIDDFWSSFIDPRTLDTPPVEPADAAVEQEPDHESRPVIEQPWEPAPVVRFAAAPLQVLSVSKSSFVIPALEEAEPISPITPGGFISEPEKTLVEVEPVSLVKNLTTSAVVSGTILPSELPLLLPKESSLVSSSNMSEINHEDIDPESVSPAALRKLERYMSSSKFSQDELDDLRSPVSVPMESEPEAKPAQASTVAGKNPEPESKVAASAAGGVTRAARPSVLSPNKAGNTAVIGTGDRVQVRRSGGSEWFTATVTNKLPGNRFEVLYDGDNGKESNVARVNIRSLYASKEDGAAAIVEVVPQPKPMLNVAVVPSPTRAARPSVLSPNKEGNTAVISTGDRVLVKKMGGVQWFPATVTNKRPGDQYDVIFDYDGSHGQGVARVNIRSLYASTLGIEIAPKPEPATESKVTASAAASVTRTARPSVLSPNKAGNTAVIGTGDRVQVRRSGGTEWFTATVTNKQPGDRFEVLYDGDNGKESNVARVNIRSLYASSDNAPTAVVAVKSEPQHESQPVAAVPSPTRVGRPSVLSPNKEGNTAVISTGDRVLVKKTGGVQWFPATVTNKRPGDQYDVIFDYDGSHGQGVARVNIRSLYASTLGIEIAPKPEPATESKVAASAAASVTRTARPSVLSPNKAGNTAVIGTGDRVQVRRSGGSEWFTATVFNKKPGDHFDVIYDDEGKHELNVPRLSIRSLYTPSTEEVHATPKPLFKMEPVQSAAVRMSTTGRPSVLMPNTAGISAGVSIGDHVMIKRSQDGQWCSATVTNKRPGDHYDVMFDEDGSKENNIPRANIRAMPPRTVVESDSESGPDDDNDDNDNDDDSERVRPSRTEDSSRYYTFDTNDDFSRSRGAFGSFSRSRSRSPSPRSASPPPVEMVSPEPVDDFPDANGLSAILATLMASKPPESPNGKTPTAAAAAESDHMTFFLSSLSAKVAKDVTAAATANIVASSVSSKNATIAASAAASAPVSPSMKAVTFSDHPTTAVATVPAHPVLQRAYSTTPVTIPELSTTDEVNTELESVLKSLPVVNPIALTVSGNDSFIIGIKVDDTSVKPTDIFEVGNQRRSIYLLPNLEYQEGDRKLHRPVLLSLQKSRQAAEEAAAGTNGSNSNGSSGGEASPGRVKTAVYEMSLEHSSIQALIKSRTWAKLSNQSGNSASEKRKKIDLDKDCALRGSSVRLDYILQLIVHLWESYINWTVQSILIQAAVMELTCKNIVELVSVRHAGTFYGNTEMQPWTEYYVELLQTGRDLFVSYIKQINEAEKSLSEALDQWEFDLRRLMDGRTQDISQSNYAESVLSNNMQLISNALHDKISEYTLDFGLRDLQQVAATGVAMISPRSSSGGASRGSTSVSLTHHAPPTGNAQKAREALAKMFQKNQMLGEADLEDVWSDCYGHIGDSIKTFLHSINLLGEYNIDIDDVVFKACYIVFMNSLVQMRQFHWSRWWLHRNNCIELIGQEVLDTIVLESEELMFTPSGTSMMEGSTSAHSHDEQNLILNTGGLIDVIKAAAEKVPRSVYGAYIQRDKQAAALSPRADVNNQCPIS